MEYQRIFFYPTYIVILVFSFLFAIIGYIITDKMQVEEKATYELNMLEENEGYESYLNLIDENAENAEIFYDKNSYATQNALKTKMAYEPMKKIKLTDDQSYGAYLFLKTSVIDYSLAFLCFFLLYFYFMRDNERGVQGITSVTKSGCSRLVRNRFWNVLLHLTVSFFVLYGFKLVYCMKLYGFGDVTRSIQSVYGMKNFVYPLSVLQYILIYSIYRWLAIVGFSMLLSFVMVRMKQPIILIAIIGIVLVLEYLLYQKIEVTSSFVWLKWINVIAMCFSSVSISKYFNISVLQHPVNLATITIVLFIALCCVAYIDLSRAPEKMKYKTPHFRLGTVIHKPTWSLKACSKLVVWEFRKLFIWQKSLFVMLLLIIGLCYSYHPSKVYYGELDETGYKNYMEEIKGYVTEDTLEKIEKDDEAYEVLMKSMEEHPEDLSFHYEEFEKQQNIHNILQRVKGKVAHAQKKEGRYLVYDTGYEWLLGLRGLRHFALLFAVLILCIILCNCGVYAFDNMNSMNMLIATTKNGFRNRKRILWFQTILLYTIQFVLIFGYRMLGIYKEYGYADVHSSAGGLMIGIITFDQISIFSLLIMYHIVYYLIGLLVVVICITISKKSKSYMQSMLISMCGGSIIWTLTYLIGTIVLR